MHSSNLRDFLNTLITNNQTTNFYNHITKLLQECESFIFNVAFVNFSGIQLLLDSFEILEKRNIKGKILTSTYLNFTQIKALEKIKEFNNIELKIYDSNASNIGFHSKSYIFEFKDNYKVLIGSSNITASAFKSNIEWNIKTIAKKDDAFLQDVLSEFENLWIDSYEANDEFLKEYADFLNKQKKEFIPEFTYRKSIKTNFMQEKALEKLEELRVKKEKKALVIAATGSGKTYLSAFDVKKVQPKTLLFLVHRENILLSAKKSFETILGDNFTYGLYTGNKKEEDKNYIFSTIQTMTNSFSNFSQNHFDYIIIDEAHHVTSPSYKKVIEYFKPKFLLGLTATSNRMDGNSIYEIFDENIACDIRLNDALEHNLVVPFHYFGICDINTIDYENVDLNKIDVLAKLLSVNKRVDFIIDKMNFYSNSGNKRKVLGFCVSKEHGFFMSEKFNEKGINSLCLTSEDSIQKREETIKKLEDEKDSLEVIFTVDIFNEGIDIPSVNQVVMLRNTQSSIIFIQQLGRGLRKHDSKEYVTIIDFIGNYRNNYLIPVALFGDQTMNKDNYRREVREPNILKGLTTINFEKVAKELIFSSITNTTLSSIKILRDAFKDLENKLGRVPYLSDFVKLNSIDPLVFFENSSFQNYGDVINKFSEETILLSEVEKRFLNFITFEILNGKRKHELYLLNLLVENEGLVSSDKWFEFIIEHDLDFQTDVLDSVTRVLDLSFLKAQEQKKYCSDPLVDFDGDMYRLNNAVYQSLENNSIFAQLFIDTIITGILKSKEYPEIFTLGQKYTRREVLKLMNVAKDEPPLNIGGYKIDKDTNSCPIFITYHKSEDISDTIKYEDELLNESTLKWFSKNKRTLDSNDVSTIIHSNENGLRLELFVIKDDSEAGEFYYLGPLKYVENSASEIIKSGDSVVQMLFKIGSPVETNLYKYLTDK